MSVFMVVGVSVCVYASAGLGVDTDKTELNATFSYNEGHTLDIQVDYTEYHSGINHHYRCVDVNKNMGSEVKYSVKVKPGYEFEIASYSGKVDGSESAKHPSVRPQ